MSELIGDIVESGPRPLPVFLLLDRSGSMDQDGKIGALNMAVRDMLRELARVGAESAAAIHVGVISFSTDARWDFPLQPAASIAWSDLQADGSTQMGRAIDLVTAAVDDYQNLPRRAYRSNLILISDGQPTNQLGDEDLEPYRAAIARLNASERGAKTFRLALAIGSDCRQEVLREFLSGPNQRVYHADEIWQIRAFLDLATDTMLKKAASKPNVDPALPTMLGATRR